MALFQSPNIVTDKLVFYLDAANTKSYPGSGTTWKDISKNDNNCTLNNMPSDAFKNANLGFMDFDGSDDFVGSARDALFYQFGTSDYTFGNWVKYDLLDEYVSTISIGHFNYVGSWQLDLTGSGVVRYKLKASSGNLDFNSTLTPTLGRWYYIVVTSDRSENNAKIYVDGVLNATSSTDSQYGSLSIGTGFGDNSDNIFKIGKNRGNDHFLNGGIAQVQVYNGKALTAAEVLQNYNAHKGRYM